MINHIIKVRNAGHKSQYYTLTIMREGVENEIHTSKNLQYLWKYIPAKSVEVKT